MTTLPERPRRRDAIANREAILAAAADVLRRDPAASIDAVASRAGLSRRAVYGHFATRDDLVIELVRRGAERIDEALAGVSDPDPAVHIARIGSALWDQIAEVKLVAQAALHGPAAESAVAALEGMRRSLRAALRRGADSGVFRPHVAVESLARFIERQALDVLDEAVNGGLDDDAARHLVVVSCLGIAGLGWRDADRLAAIAGESSGGAA